MNFSASRSRLSNMPFSGLATLSVMSKLQKGVLPFALVLRTYRLDSAVESLCTLFGNAQKRVCG